MKEKTKKRLSKVLLSVLIVAIALLLLSPFYLLVLNSFKTLNEITHNVGAMPEEVQTANYVKAWTQLQFPRALLNSLIVTVLSNAVVVLASSMAAYRITRHPGPVKNLLYTAFLAEMVLPFQVIMIPLTVILQRMGMINSLWGLIFANSGLGVAMGVFTYSGFIKSIPRDLEEAALIDGCSEIRMFFKIVFPLLKPTTATLIVINTFWYWNDYLLPRLILSSKELRTIPIAIDSLMDAVSYGAFGTVLLRR